MILWYLLSLNVFNINTIELNDTKEYYPHISLSENTSSFKDYK